MLRAKVFRRARYARHARFLGTGARAPAPVILSGIQPSGVPHLGNYLGALRHWDDLQRAHADTDAKLLFSIVDLHALTADPAPDALRQHRRQLLAMLLAVGIDPARSIVFFQSAVPAHAELMWILSCHASAGSLSRMTQWKVRRRAGVALVLTMAPLQSKLALRDDASLLDRSARNRLRLGLFSYPVLQAADVLIHR